MQHASEQYVLDATMTPNRIIEEKHIKQVPAALIAAQAKPALVYNHALDNRQTAGREHDREGGGRGEPHLSSSHGEPLALPVGWRANRPRPKPRLRSGRSSAIIDLPVVRAGLDSPG